MINLTPAFLSEYHNFSRGFPNGIDTVINVPNLEKVGKKITVTYKDQGCPGTGIVPFYGFLDLWYGSTGRPVLFPNRRTFIILYNY